MENRREKNLDEMSSMEIAMDLAEFTSALPNRILKENDKTELQKDLTVLTLMMGVLSDRLDKEEN